MSTAEIDQLLASATQMGASDLHLRIGLPPMIRHHGAVWPLAGEAPLTKERMERMVGSMLSDEHKRDFYENKSVDFAHSVPGMARFRVNFFIQQKLMGGVMRRIPEQIPSLADLAAPKALLDFARQPRGLVLVTGPTGSGKSTTLAAVIDIINSERADHILTIEEPVEFVHKPKRSIINQREVGPDTPSFKRALRDALREDPDVILVGEMRDFETISIALTAAETGHLVFGTLHTSTAESSISRVIDVFPADQQQQVRTMLASSLVGIVCQTLLPRADGEGRVAAHEVLVATNAVRANIRDNQLPQIRNSMQTGHRYLMQTLDKSLAHLVVNGVVAEDVAAEKSVDPREYADMLNAMRRGGDVAPPQLILPGDLSDSMGTTTILGAAEAQNNAMYNQVPQQPVAPQPPQPSMAKPAPQAPQQAAPQPSVMPQAPQQAVPQPSVMPQAPQQAAPPQPSAMPQGTPQPPAPPRPSVMPQTAPQPMSMPDAAPPQPAAAPKRGMRRLFKEDDPTSEG